MSINSSLLTTTVLLTASVAVSSSLLSYHLIKKRHQRKATATDDENDNDDCTTTIPKDLLLKAANVQDDKSSYIPQVELAIKLAVEAGQNMRSHYDSVGCTNPKVKSTISIVKNKGDVDGVDFATDIDTKNEALVENGIRALFPDDEIIGEESCSSSGIPPLTKKPTWIIDPIDGTTNFACGLPLTCVSIGYCSGGKPVMGVVYAPMTNELFVGVTGFGAWRNGELISGGKFNSHKTLNDSAVCFEFGYARSQESVNKMTFAVNNILTHGCKSCRSLGSGVLDICYIARGSLDLLYTGVADEGWSPWDYVAGLVICSEAGCHAAPLHTEDIHEEFNIYMKSAIFGANKNLVDECRQVILKNFDQNNRSK